MLNLKALKAAAEAATPGPWDVWAETTMTKEDAISELAFQVKHTPDQDFAGAVYLLNADGKCPALTGCGPRSKENADFIALANPSTILSLIERCEELEGALRPFADTYRAKSDPGTADLYDEQPQAWHVPLGAWRRASRQVRALSKADATS